MTKAQQIMRLRRATGMGVLESRMFLIGKAPELVDRIIRARETQSARLLHDPIEDEPQFRDAVRQADDAVNSMLKDEPKRMSLCHLHWNYKKNYLKRHFGILWYSPAEMNPSVIFD
jgi:hypothetical protein